MVQSADQGGGIEQTRDERQAVDISRDVDVTPSLTKPLLRLAELGARIVQQHNALETAVTGGVPACARAQLEQQLTGFWQQSLQGDRFHAVFIFTTTSIPEAGLVV